MNYLSLRKFIRLILSEKKNLIGEPDMTNAEVRKKEKEKKKKKIKKSSEASVAAGLPGVSTPLGTGPTYPAKVVKKAKKKKK